MELHANMYNIENRSDTHKTVSFKYGYDAIYTFEHALVNLLVCSINKWVIYGQILYYKIWMI